MKKLLGSVDIYFDPDSTDASGLHGYGNKFEIVLTREIQGRRFDIDDIPALQTVMAHELGHLVNDITKDPTHANPHEIKLNALLFGNGKGLVRAEQKAWETAEQIKPDLNQEIRAGCLKSYTDAFGQ